MDRLIPPCTWLWRVLVKSFPSTFSPPLLSTKYWVTMSHLAIQVAVVFTSVSIFLMGFPPVECSVGHVAQQIRLWMERWESLGSFFLYPCFSLSSRWLNTCGMPLVMMVAVMRAWVLALFHSWYQVCVRVYESLCPWGCDEGGEVTWVETVVGGLPQAGFWWRDSGWFFWWKHKEFGVWDLSSSWRERPFSAVEKQNF